MTSRFRLVVLSGAIVVSLALPAASQALTKQVYDGLPPKAQKKFIDPKLNTDAIDFFPHSDDDPRRRLGQVHDDGVPQRRHPGQGQEAGDAARSRPGRTSPGSNDAAGTRTGSTAFRTSASTRTSSRATRRSTTTRGRRPRARRMAFTYTGAKGVATPIPFGDEPQAADREVHQGRDGQVLLRPAPGHGGRHPRPARSPRRSRAPRPTRRR